MKISEIVNKKINLSLAESELDYVYRKNAELQAKVSQATSFLKGLKDTPDDVTLGVLRNFIDANYKNITK